MTGALLALAIAAAQAGGVVRSTDAAGRRTPADSVLVRGGVRDTTLAIVATSAGSALRADAVAAALGGVLRVARLGQWTIELAGVLFDLEEGVPFAGSRGAVYPLAGPPLVRDGALLIPLQLVADLAPRAGGNLTWDAGRRELRLGRGNPGVVTASAAARAASTTSPPAGAGTAPVAPPRAAKRYTVVVDAGHGGPDPGMRGPIGGSFTIYEKDVTLAVAKQLARALETRGVDVVMTRTTDTLIALSDRGRIANDRRGDLFISVHVNAAPRSWKNPGTARGFETYFLDEAKTEDERRVAEMENDAVRFETGPALPRDDALGFILSDMKQNEHLRESNDLAAKVQEHLKDVHPGPSRGVMQAPFRVLVTAFMPAVLLEIGFGTNPVEAAWIASVGGQRTIALAVADAAIEYFAHYQRRAGGSGGAPAGPRE